MQITEYDRGFKDGLRWAITFVHNQASEMNDIRARDILNTAAFHLGVEGGNALPEGMTPGGSKRLQSVTPPE
ncbi:MAG: hypothetical protein AAB227_04820 [Pseudomonadota bacterium]